MILLFRLIDLYMWLVIAAAIFSWLIAFNVVNYQNRFVALVGDFLYKVTEPALRPIRNIVPIMGGLDLSPLILLLLLWFLKRLILDVLSATL
ncbi:MAG: YggT family protein [Alphaproteobacteria bacterium]